MPFLVKQLGVETYGLWALITAITGYFLILDLGMSTAVGRLMAGCRASGDLAKLNTIISTVAVLFIAICFVIWMVTFAIVTIFFQFFHVPPAQYMDVHNALMINGLSIGLFVLGVPFYSMLWGYERFDLANSVDIPVLLARTAMVFWLFREGGSLVELSFLTLLGNVASAILYMLQCWRLEPRLSVKPSHCSLEVAKSLFHFAKYYSFLTISRTLTAQIGTLIVGHGLNYQMVTTFSVARQLTVYSNNFIVSVTQVATARAAVLYFGDQIDRQRALFIEGGKYAMALSCFFAIGFFVLGAPFLMVWQRGLLDHAYLPLIVLTIGEIVPMSQWVTFGIITSMGKHRILGIFAVLEAVAIVASAPALASEFRVVGVCAAVGFAGFVFRGLCQFVYGCKLLEITPLSYTRKVFVPVLIPSFMQLGLFGLASIWFAPRSWPQLILAGAIYALSYGLLLSPFLFGWRKLPRHARMLLQRIQGPVA